MASFDKREGFYSVQFAGAPERPPSDPNLSRFFALIVACICGFFVFGYGMDVDAGYWLRKDARSGIAEVTKELWTGHNSVEYRYTVEGKEYIGASGRSYRDPKYARVQGGNHAPVWFSASQPWFSTLQEPEPRSGGFSPIGALVVLFILFVEARALLTIIAPRHRWAIDFNSRNIFRPRVSE